MIRRTWFLFLKNSTGEFILICKIIHRVVIDYYYHYSHCSYVPTVKTVHNVDITKSEDSSETISVQADFFHNILLGGDQLTCARVRGSQRIRENATNGSACTS